MKATALLNAALDELLQRVRPVLALVSNGRRGAGAGVLAGDGQVLTNLHVVGRARSVQVLLDDGSSCDSTTVLIRNFLDCIKTRQKTICTLEDGHRSTSFAHLANISLAVRQRLEWDSVNERFTNSEKANHLLSYEYRKPWKI